MSAQNDTYVLVEKDRIWLADDQPREIIKAVIRTYESNGRAQDDLALLQQMLPSLRFDILPVEYIDR